jgi:hypothetical protein
MNVNEIRSHLQFGGARPSLFQVHVTNPANGAGDGELPFMCRAASLPAWSVGTVSVPYFGRTIKLAGARTFDPWTVRVYNDEDFKVRNALEQWSNYINSLEGNVTQFSDSRPANYKSQATVTQLSKRNEVLRVYQFTGIWPSAVSTIDLDWDAGDQLEQFAVTFNYDYFQVLDGTTGNSGGT